MRGGLCSLTFLPLVTCITTLCSFMPPARYCVSASFCSVFSGMMTFCPPAWHAAQLAENTDSPLPTSAASAGCTAGGERSRVDRAAAPRMRCGRKAGGGLGRDRVGRDHAEADETARKRDASFSIGVAVHAVCQHTPPPPTPRSSRSAYTVRLAPRSRRSSFVAPPPHPQPRRKRQRSRPRPANPPSSLPPKPHPARPPQTQIS